MVGYPGGLPGAGWGKLVTLVDPSGAKSINPASVRERKSWSWAK